MNRRYFLERRAAKAFRLKDYEKALEALDELLSILGDNPNTLHAAGICYQRLGRYEDALRFAHQGARVDPIHLGCLELLTELHTARGEMETAVHFARKALKRIEELRGGPENGAVGGFRWAAIFRPALSSRRAMAAEREWARWAQGLLEQPPGTR